MIEDGVMNNMWNLGDDKHAQGVAYLTDSIPNKLSLTIFYPISDVMLPQHGVPTTDFQSTKHYSKISRLLRLIEEDRMICYHSYCPVRTGILGDTF